MFHPYTLKLDGGKYTVINDNGQMTFLRHGEPWPAADDLKHAGVVLAMAQRIEELEVAIGEVLNGSLDEQGTRAADGITSILSGVIAVRGTFCNWEDTLRRALEQK
jgi:hypothetical protein